MFVSWRLEWHLMLDFRSTAALPGFRWSALSRKTAVSLSERREFNLQSLTSFWWLSRPKRFSFNSTWNCTSSQWLSLSPECRSVEFRPKPFEAVWYKLLIVMASMLLRLGPSKLFESLLLKCIDRSLKWLLIIINLSKRPKNRFRCFFYELTWQQYSIVFMFCKND